MSATTPQGKSSGGCLNFINYENDNIWETDDNRMISTRKVQDHYHFWELIDTFFKANIPKELLAEMENFYRMRAEQIKLVHAEVQNQSRDNIKLSKHVRAMLLENDHELNPEPPNASKQQQKQMKELEKRYIDLLYADTLLTIEDDIRAARHINPVKTSNTTHYIRSQVQKRME